MATEDSQPQPPPNHPVIAASRRASFFARIRCR